ncbi:autotransporter-associated beta strand repeat-containing protein [Luteolibacter arcticus]|uniref:Autotransporter-associated beta strand repeat-containing protein n=1 Tax=Luteolibacter arcticus TaxID=1581411 RepID=A0ABT3GRJ2_9BACT|nr:autotransporter-associated beta strand repeat-containing protein [Luteolibacter arcticus]MCW1926117.1 autotransporter-associated beta strand repeat-containing protein [Luteolibacter arcticus]
MDSSTLRRTLLHTALLTTVTTAHAQLYFDINAATAGSGTPGAAAWNTGTNWSAAPAGDVATVGWTNGQAAIFSAGTEAAGTWNVTVTGTVQTNSITFNGATNSTVHNITGGTIDMATGGLVLDASAAAGTTGRSKTISSAIIGSGGLSIAANGDTSATGGGSNTIFSLTGANTFTGNTTITAGVVGYTSIFGDAANSVVLNGGGLLFNNTGTFTRNLQIEANGGVFRNYGAATSTLTGTLSGSGSIRRTDGGTAIYAGNGSAFTGALLVERGTLQAGNGVLTANPLANASGATLGDATGAGVLRYQLDGSFTLATPITYANAGSALIWQGTDAGDVMTINNIFGVANNTGTLQATSGAITLASGADVLVGAITLSSTPSNSATAVIGTLNVQPGAVLETRFMNIGDGGNNAGAVNQTGGTVKIATGGNGFRIGHWDNGANTPGSVYNLSGGTLDVSAIDVALNVGWDGAGTLNVSNTGLAKAWRLYVDAGGQDKPGIVNLTGGTIEVGAGGISSDGTAGSQLNLSGGTLKATSGSTWAAPMNATAATTSVIDVNGSTILSTGAFTGTGAVNVTDTATGGTFEFSQPAGTRTISPALGGSTTIRKSGAGTLVLSGNNTHTGNLFPDAGVLSLTGSNAFSIVDINDGVTFTGEGSTSGALSLGVTSGATLGVNHTTTGAFHVGGNLTLNGTSVISLGTPFSGTTNLLTYSGTLSGNASNLILPGAANYRSASVNFNPGVISLTINNADLTWTGTGGGLWDLNATSGWSNGGSNTFFWGDTVRFDDTSAVPAVAITGELAPNKITVDSDTNNYTITGGTGNFISGLGSLLKTGSSTLTISAPNTFSGGTIISEGTIVITGVNGGLGTGSVTLGDAATGNSPVELRLTNGRNIPNNITISSLATGSALLGYSGTGGSYTEFTGNIALQRDLTIRSGTTDRLHFTGAITGTGNLTIDGGKRVTMSGNNTYAGNLLIRDADTIFQTFGANSIPDTATVDVGANAIFQVYLADTIAGLTGTGFLQPIAGKPTLTVGNGNVSSTFSGTWRPLVSDHLNLTKIGTGTFTLSGPISSPGAITISGGTVEITSAGLFGRTLAAGTALPNRALIGTGTFRTSGSADVTLRRSSAGFTGAVQINGGVTTVGHSAALATAPVSINGGTLRFDNSGTNFTPLAANGLTTGTLTTDVTTNNLATLHAATGDVIPANMTHVYHGQIYLTAGQWTFAENFDDGAAVTISGTPIINDAVYNAVTTGTFSAPDDGWYTIDVRAYQIGGASGGVGAWATAGIGIGIKAGGTSTNVADYVALTDGALGTRLTTSNSYSFSNAITLAGPATIDTSTMVGTPGVAGVDGNGNSGDVTLTGVVSGTGSLTKTGVGTLLLNSANTYSGNTRVDAGRLTLATATLANAADVYIASGAVLNLIHGTNDTVHSLFINGVGLAVGTYNATSHPGIITGTGSLVVTTAGGSPFDSWASANGVSGGGVDSDADGIANGIEFVIGGDPSGPGSDSNSLLPTAAILPADPNYLTVVYRRTTASASMPVAQQPYVQYGTTLSSWTKAEHNVSGVIIAEDPNGFGTGIARVTVKIPRNLTTGKVFARLRVDIP